MRTSGLSSRAPPLTQLRLRTCSVFKKDLIKSVVLKDRRNQRHNRHNRRNRWQRWRWTWRWQDNEKPMVLRALISAVDGARWLKTAVDIE